MNAERKKIVIEALAAGLPPCGLREYAMNVCPRLVQRCRPEWNMIFIVPRGMKGCFGPQAGYIEAHNLNIPVLRNLPVVKADLFHALHQLCRVKNLPGAKYKLLTVHDVNFAHTRRGPKYERSAARFTYRLRHATHLAFISRFAREDVQTRFPFSQLSRVIYNGVTAPDLTEAVRPAGVPDGPFLFHLSSLVPYKNPHLLIEMMDALPDLTLVIAGRCKHRDLADLAAKRRNVVMVGSVSDSEKAWLYANCSAFLFPSVAEGFGLPPIEAMSAGKPVFLSTATSLPEVGGDLAFYWPDLVPDKMAAMIREKLPQAPAADRLMRHAAQFDWDNTAAEYIRFYKDILSND